MGIEHGLGLVFGFGKERADFFGGGAVERALGEVAAVGEAQAADLRFHGGDRGKADAEFVNAEADEDRHGVRIAGDAAADAGKPLCACAPSMVCAMSRSTAGFSASTFGASFGWPRSIASVYCVRSLVPMEKKSASAAKVCAMTATAGTSTMMPHGIGATPSAAGFLGQHRLRVAQLLHGCDHREHDVQLARREARSSARSCVRKTSGRSSPTRMPRSPRKGLSSRGIGR